MTKPTRKRCLANNKARVRPTMPSPRMQTSKTCAMATIVGGRHNGRMNTLQATIAQLWVYPIKSCAGLLRQEAALTPTGLAWDRCFMVVDAYGEMVTQRDLPRMALIQPELNTAPDVMQMTVRAPGMPDLLLPLVLPAQVNGMQWQLEKQLQSRVANRVKVRVWDDEVPAFDLGDEASQWFTQFLDTSHQPSFGALRLVRFDTSHARVASRTWTQSHTALNQFSDGFPILVASIASLNLLNQRLQAQGKKPVDMRRFRANVVLAGTEAHDEDRVAQMQITTASPNGQQSEVVLKLVKPCPRCPIPNIDPDTAQSDTAVGDTLQGYRQDPRLDGQITFGMNAMALQGEGQMLRVGQPVRGEWIFE